ncbi:hypothetical protein V2J09_005655 [Rumex salicifolius]
MVNPINNLPDDSSAADASRLLFNDSPLLISNSDQLGTPLGTPIFYGSRYGEWRRAVKVSLSVKNKWCFVTDSLNRLEDKHMISHSVIYLDSTKEIWDILESRFGQSSSSQRFALQKELVVVTQGNSTEFSSKDVNDKKKLVCDDCKKIVHLIDKCYRLHGIPTDFKFTKNKKVVATVSNGPPANSGIQGVCGAVTGTATQTALNMAVPVLTF